MRRSVVCAAILFFAVSAYADDQEKAEKQIRMMTAMSRDDTARAIISRTFADAFKMQRKQLVAQRKSLGLNYGGLFLAHQLASSGMRVEQVAAQLRAHGGLREIGGVDWRHIANEAKKMNSRITDGIYKHFLHSKPDEERDKLEHYNSSYDLIRADADSTPDEILNAQKTYVFWRNLAAPMSDGQADRSTPVGQSYEQHREDIAVTHGTDRMR